MNYCKRCGQTAPEGKELCWLCEHSTKLRRPQAAFEKMTPEDFAKDINVPAEEECEMCKISTPERNAEDENSGEG